MRFAAVAHIRRPRHEQHPRGRIRHFDLHPSVVRLDSGTSDAFGLAPAIEYNWKGNLGVLVGARVILAGRNTAFTITPAVAVNSVHS